MDQSTQGSEANRNREMRRGPLILLTALVALVLLAFATRSQWDWLLADDEARTTGVEAPTLVGVDDTERLYRIAPDAGSTLSYSVAEELAGQDGVATGSTSVMAGDIAINIDDPEATRLGQMVINVETFESDSTLRDKRIRHDFLESTHWPFATFDPGAIEGLPDAIDGSETTAEVTISGDLTLKETTHPVTFTGTATLSETKLTAEMTGVVLMSDYDIGPIHVAGLAHTGDEVTFTLDIAADRVDTDAAAPGRDALALQVGDPNFADGEFSSVQPIIEARCASCHVKGGSGYATVAMHTAGEAAEIADDIALVTGHRFMPPWPASDLSLDFEHDYSLTDDEIAAIAAWADAGGGLDVPADTELEPTGVTFEPIERDQVIAHRGDPYVGELAKKDDYRCFIHEVDDPEGDGEWITGMDFQADNAEIAHHSIVYRVPAAGRDEAERLDYSDGRVGWECFGRSNMETPNVVSIGGWAPGQQPRVYPDGVGIFLEPGDFIVNQIHYHFDHETPPDRASLVLDTLSPDEMAARETAMTPIAGRSYLTPAEGPCTPEEEGPLCDRDNMIDQFRELYGGVAPFIPDALIRACGGTLEDYNELFEETKFFSSCDLRAQDYGTLYSVLGHMHEFGDAYRMILNPDTPEERILLDIPDWSFEWQLYYVPEEEVRIEPGDIIRFQCTWDRNNNNMEEPRYITWNEGTVDEMCFSSVSVIPDVDSEGQPRQR